MAVTAPRFIAETTVGLDWQASEGESVPAAPYTPRQFMVAKVYEPNQDPKYIHPNGTHGSIFKRYDGDRIVTQSPKVELRLWGGKYQILPFLESVVGGSPTVAFADLSISGGASISALSLTGVRPYHNVSGYVSTPSAVPQLFIETLAAGGPAFPVTVNFYRDSARLEKVAHAAVAAGATPTALVADNSSGLGGSVTLSAAANSTPTATLATLTEVFATQYARYFRLYYTDGDEAVCLSDCVADEVHFESSEHGELAVIVKIMAKRRTVTASSTFAPSQTQLDLVAYSHSELVLTKDPAGSPVLPIVDHFTFFIKNKVHQYVGNSALPQKLIKQGWVDLGGVMRGEPSDELMGMVRDARSNTAAGTGYNRFTAVYTLGSKALTFDMQKMKPMLKEPGLKDELVDKVDFQYEAHYDGSTSPLAVTVQL